MKRSRVNAAAVDPPGVVEWCRSNGCIIHGSLAFAGDVNPSGSDSPPSGTHEGVRAVRSIAQGELLLRVPLPLCLDGSSDGVSVPGKAQPGRDPWRALALRLLRERARGRSSPVASFVSALPTVLSAPAFWPRSDRSKLLRGTALEEGGPVKDAVGCPGAPVPVVQRFP